MVELFWWRGDFTLFFIKAGTASISCWTADGLKSYEHSYERLLAGKYTYNVPLHSLDSGVYFLSVLIDGRRDTHKLMVRK